MDLSTYHSLRSRLARLLSAVPSCCALCGRSAGAALCQPCRQRYLPGRHIGCLRCLRCALPLAAADTLCSACLSHPPAYDASIVAAGYAPPLDQLVLGLKFGRQLALAPLFAQLLAQALQQSPAALPQLLVAVPLGAQRLAERGYNQALEIARPLSRMLGIRLEPRLLVRHRDTAPQSLLPPSERRPNVRHAFTVSAPAIDRVRGCHVGVVDDVMTTGETMADIAATLKRFGAARVSCLAVARTDPK
jgi:ComF family protein